MAETTVQEQIVREAPEIEARRLGLIDLAKELSSQRLELPEYRIAGLSPQQQRALKMASAGVGAYQPYLETAGDLYGEAARGFRGVSDYGADIVGALQRGASQVGSAGQLAMGDIRQGGNLARMGASQANYNIGQGAYLANQYARGAVSDIDQAAALAGQYGRGAVSDIDAAAARALGSAGQGVGSYRTAANIGMRAGQGALSDIDAAALQAVNAAFRGAQSYDPRSVQQYMNPYEAEVVANAMRDIRREGEIMQQGIAGQAARAGAFGGSRFGVQAAETNRATLEKSGDTAAQLRMAGYNQAQAASMNAFQNQQARLQQAGNMALGAGQAQAAVGLQAGKMGMAGQQALGQSQFNLGQMGLQAGQAQAATGLQAGQLGLTAGQAQAATGMQAGQLGLTAGQAQAATALQGGQLGLQAGQAEGALGLQAGQLGLTAQQMLAQGYQSAAGLRAQEAAGLASLGQQQVNLGQMYSGLGQGDTSFLYNIGSQQQQYQQRILDARRISEMQQLYEPYQRVSFLSDIYKGAPSSQMAITSATAPSPSLLSQGIGLGTAGIAAYNYANYPYR